MKVLISHDVDHMTFWEHRNDMIIPKLITRAWLEFFKRKISSGELIARHTAIVQNKWQNIEEVMHFNSKMGINSTFFIGVNNGVGLNYPIKYAEKWIPIVLDRGFEVGVHGINYNSKSGIQEEFNLFKSISGLASFGIRMHYLRQDENTFKYLSEAGYLYDASSVGLNKPYWENNFWNFPLQIMDGWVVNGNRRFQVRNLEQCQKFTIDLIEKAENAGLEYLNILFHDCYFSNSFQTWANWYKWMVKELLNRNLEFITYQEAVKELNSKQPE